MAFRTLVLELKTKGMTFRPLHGIGIKDRLGTGVDILVCVVSVGVNFKEG